jgi:hypothetical protein
VPRERSPKLTNWRKSSAGHSLKSYASSPPAAGPCERPSSTATAPHDGEPRSLPPPRLSAHSAPTIRAGALRAATNANPDSPPNASTETATSGGSLPSGRGVVRVDATAEVQLDEEKLVEPPTFQRLAFRPYPMTDEALDSYLERLAARNHIESPRLIARLSTASTRHLAIAPDPDLLLRCTELTGLARGEVARLTLASFAGISTTAGDSAGWKRVGRAWAPARGTKLCPDCYAETGAWKVSWRHPWVTVCLNHGTWLLARCPSCGLPFRSQRHSPLRSVDARPSTCGNPGGARGMTCGQDLRDLVSMAAPTEVLDSQQRIGAAVRHGQIDIAGGRVSGEDFLTEVRVLAVLLLHLACQPGSEPLAPWAPAAHEDKGRSVGGCGARWALSPPADPSLHGLAMAAADRILATDCLDASVQLLAPWIELTPPVPEGRLGWLADRTAATPLLTRLLMAATSTRMRMALLLPQQPAVGREHIPQVVPSGPYEQHLAALLDVNGTTGRIYASLCLARLGQPSTTWDNTAKKLGLPAELGTKTARACSAGLLCTPVTFVEALRALVADLEAIDFDARVKSVRRLASTTRWYDVWARRYTPGSHATSRSHATTWLWAEYAGQHIDTSPGWCAVPTPNQRRYYRRYAKRLSDAARQALAATVNGPRPHPSPR